MQDHTSEISGRIRWGAIVLAAAATLAVGTMAVASENPIDPMRTTPQEVRPPTDPYNACLRAGSMTPDRIDARAAECRLRTEILYADPAYVGCMRRASATPDAMEHRVALCILLAQP
ncbi:MAG: hypothetical protein WAS51_08890 [Ilumatobacteraceae bacterium]